jgi:ribosomal protein S18 acetylase RimI-like enzyme
MAIITINSANIDREHICCAIGNDKANQARALTKKDWMRERFKDGLVFKRLDERGKVFIEYMPIEKVWKPIVGKNYMAINCLWVSGQFKGKGYSKQLLGECLHEAQAQGMDGVAVVTSNKVKPFLTDKKFFLKHGFQTVDTAPPYFELLALKFNPAAETPRFSDHARAATTPDKDGFTFVYSNQCPFMEEYVGAYAAIAQKNGVPAKVVKLSNHEEAQAFGSPFGTLGIYLNGAFLMHELMTEAKFEALVKIQTNTK